MSATHASFEDYHEPGLYEIRIKGHLDNRWADWFDLIDVSPGGSAQFLALPVAVFEIILLPFWLLFRGFKTPEAPEHPRRGVPLRTPEVKI